MICKYCNTDKTADSFYSYNKSKCKKCCYKTSRDFALKHPISKERQKVYREAHKEKQKEYYKKWYAENGRRRSINHQEVIVKWRKRNKEACKASRKVEIAIKNGQLVRPDVCEACNEKGYIVAHHEDYTKPLIVRWICQSCHKKVHLNVDKPV